MRSLLIAIVILTVALAGNVVAISRLAKERDALKQEEGVGLLFPSSIASVIALDYKSLLADFLFFRAQIYYGGKLIRKEELTNDEWTWIYKSAELATDLDPYFLDPYYLTSMNLAWTGRVEEANQLLAKAMRFRTWDWTIPFYLGFNYFYFLHENEMAGKFLMEAARKPGGTRGIAPSLAARLAYQERQTENSVMFLEEILKRTDDEAMRGVYAFRLDALKRILYLEKATDFFKEKFGKYPGNLDELVSQKVIAGVPADPYGGKFYIDPDGAIKTTSNLKSGQGW